jgi:hypothetical protein
MIRQWLDDQRARRREAGAVRAYARIGVILRQLRQAERNLDAVGVYDVMHATSRVGMALNPGQRDAVKVYLRLDAELDRARADYRAYQSAAARNPIGVSR